MRVLLTSFLNNLIILLPSPYKGARVRGWGLLLVLFILLPSPCKGARAGDGGCYFDHYSWDFGEIEEAEGTVSHTFRLKNEGATPLYVGRAIPSCTCITAQLPQGAILPGKEGEVEVSFSPSGAVGATFRSLEITDSEGRLLGTLSIEADVIPIDRSIQERYFYTLGDMLYANLSTVPFGYIYPGDTITKTVFLANASHKIMNISADKSFSPRLLVDAPESLAPGEELPITLSYAIPAESQWTGTLNDTLRLNIDGKPALLPITTSAIALDRLPNQPASEAPSLRTYPSSGKLVRKATSSSSLTESYEATIEVHNDGKSPLLILKIEAPDGLNAIVDQETISPGEQTKLRIGCKQVENMRAASKQAEKYRIRLFSNDPKRRYRDIDILK